MLNTSSLSCSTPGLFPSTTTRVSITGNYPEFKYYVNSDVNGFGDWRIKYSSAPTPVEHTIPYIIDISYGADSQYIAAPIDVQRKEYQGGSLGGSTNSPSSILHFTLDAMKSAIDVLIGSDFGRALTDNGSANC